MPNKKKDIPLFIVEEHHEAYIVWKYCVINKLIKSESNCLLHIDEHSDMGTPNTNYSVCKLDDDLENVKKFVYNELNIATFIIPTIYEKLLDKIYWLKQHHNKVLRKPNKLYVRTQNNAGKNFIVERASLLNSFNGSQSLGGYGIVNYTFYKIHTTSLPKLKNIILDIDLDYFSCVQNPLKECLKIEITENEYESFCDNKYHRLRYFDFEKIIARKENGKFHYYLNLFDEPYESPLRKNPEQIKVLIDSLVDKFKQNQITPQIITICRSRFSGYTPADQWSFIEESLKTALGSLYDIKSIKHISQL